MYDQDTTTVLSDLNLALVEELRLIRESVKQLKSREEAVRKILLGALKGVEQGITASGVSLVEVERYSRTRVDSNRLQALYKDVYDDCQTETSVEVLRLVEEPVTV